MRKSVEIGRVEWRALGGLGVGAGKDGLEVGIHVVMVVSLLNILLS